MSVTPPPFFFLWYACTAQNSHIFERRNENVTKRDNVLMSQMLEKLEFSISPLGKNGG